LNRAAPVDRRGAYVWASVDRIAERRCIIASNPKTGSDALGSEPLDDVETSWLPLDWPLHV
jgi:hypothetical protein